MQAQYSESNMAESGKKEREQLQEAIRVQGECIRQLKLTEQTDEVKTKVMNKNLKLYSLHVEK